MARVELGLAVGELLRGGVELRLAVVELLLLVGAIGCRGERVDGVGDAVELADVGEERADLVLLLGGEGGPVLRLEDDRPGRAAEARELVAELRVDALGLGAGNAHVRGERAAEREEAADGERERGEPGDEHGPRPTRGESTEAVQEFSHCRVPFRSMEKGHTIEPVRG